MTESPRHDSPSRHRFGDLVVIRRQTVLASLLAFAMALACSLALVSHARARATAKSRMQSVSQILDDASAIAAARVQPRRVSEADLATSELLKHVEDAMKSANLATSSLVSNIPQPVRRIPGTDYAEVGHRLLFENSTLEHITRMCDAIARTLPQLRITGIHMRAANAGAWNVDVSISYWIAADKSAPQ